MKKFYAVINIVGLFLPALPALGALPQPDRIAQIYFAGAQKITADPRFNAFTNEFCSAEAQALRAQTSGKLSYWLAGWLQTNLNVNVVGGPAKLRPLFDDLQTAEWFLEARTAANGRPEVALAIKLDPVRAQLWQANLKPFFPAASFKLVSGWLIFDSDPMLLRLGEEVAQRISTPPAVWSYLDVNWPGLGRYYPELKALALPETQFSITATNDDFSINGKFYFMANVTPNFESWRVPATLHGPFDSFTAVRGFASWLQSQKWAQPYEMAAVPNQILSWALPSFPFQTYSAVPVPDAAKTLSQLYAQLAQAVAAANLRHGFIMPVTPALNNGSIEFKGVPFMDPNLRALSDSSGQFIFMGLFPNTPRGQPLPPQLLTMLSIKNLLYYHWEITSARMPQMLQISQFGLMFTKHKQLDAHSAALRWLQRIGPKLGNTDTEIVQSGPAEFTFARRAPGIFTAAELFFIGNWLEATNFPGCDLALPPPPAPPAHPNHQPFHLTTPVSPPGH